MGRKQDKFLLLMWKNCIIIWRHPTRVLKEFLLPILWIILFLAVPIPKTELHDGIYYKPFTNKIPILKLFPTLKYIAWAPQNPQLEAIMKNVVKAISVDENVELKDMSFKNAASMASYLRSEENLLIVLAAVEFENELAGNKQLTPHISVSLRFPSELRQQPGSNWYTEKLYPREQNAGPRNWKSNEGGNPYYYDEGFLKVQEELSYSIIKHFKHSFDRKSITIAMQRFPHPKWADTSLLLQALQSNLFASILICFTGVCMSIATNVTEEKEKQLKETMKIMGLSSSLHWSAWFVRFFITITISITIFVLIMVCKWTRNPDFAILTYSNPIILFIFLEFYACATITFCFAISVFFSKADTAYTYSKVVWLLLTFITLFLHWSYERLSLGPKLLTTLFSNCALAIGFRLIISLEDVKEGLQWQNVWISKNPDDNLALGYLILILIFDSIVYLLIALYVEAIFPGNFGVPKPWRFPLTALGILDEVKYDEVEYKDLRHNANLFEKEPSDLGVGIKIQHLNKTYSGKVAAVKDFSLNVYENQITVLLGHNGAGKTTVFSMLTGMIPPTSGSAVVGGYDIRSEVTNVRDDLGFCPQHNILFDELTVGEHLYFYSKLKGLSGEKVNEEIQKYLGLLELGPKAKEASSSLTGGMKRKLSFALALCGGSRVVILDEPTARMDPISRRALWNLLLSEKEGRTVLLTTHFMDEADLLGDRIAIMSKGELQCCGSSFFLKKKYGGGYYLILDKSPRCQVDKITALLQQHIRGIQIRTNTESELIYLLNERKSSIFEAMLRDLEEHSREFGVLSYGISLTTLEEVFMKVGADRIEKTENEDKDDISAKSFLESQGENGESPLEEKIEHNIVHLEPELETGDPRWQNQVLAMFIKRGLLIVRSWKIYAIQILFSIILLRVTISALRFDELPKLKLDLKSYGHTITPLTSDAHNNYAAQFKEVVTGNEMDLDDWGDDDFKTRIFKEIEERPTLVRLDYITGATFAGNLVTVWFNNDAFHSPPLALQSVMNAVLRVEVSEEHYIQIYNDPLPYTVQEKLNRLSQQPIDMGFGISFCIFHLMNVFSSYFLPFYIKERLGKFKHLQFGSGIDLVTFWGGSFVSDLIGLMVLSLYVIIFLLTVQENGFRTFSQLGCVYFSILYFGFSALPLMYLFSFLFDNSFTAQGVFGLAVPIIVLCLFILKRSFGSMEVGGFDEQTLHTISSVVPHYSLMSGINGIYTIYAYNELCAAVRNHCVLSEEECQKLLYQVEPKCCTMAKNYLDWKAPGMGKNILISILVGLLLFGILMMVEYKVFADLLNPIRALFKHVPPAIDPHEDSDVAFERRKVNSMTWDTRPNYTIVMRNIFKYYKKVLAVNGISFSVNRNECFGLLGANGAGKTTTLRILTGDIEMTHGNVWVDGCSLETEERSIVKLMGYCPQYDALLEDLTSRETLTIFYLIRGISFKESKATVESLAKEFGLYPHLDKRVKHLSGGNKRKLSTAITVIGNAVVLVLDEPTTGVDPGSKRDIWNKLCKIRNSGRCILLTSHSMEECEALCTRLTIMVKGKFACLGSIQHLKNKFSKGYTLTVKVRRDLAYGSEETLDGEVASIEEYVLGKFSGATKKEHYLDLITFHIADTTLPYSRMFGIMEEGKKALHIDDYSLGQCSLEQVFLSFTDYQRYK